LFEAVRRPGEFIEAVVEVLGLIGAGAAPGFVVFREVWWMLVVSDTLYKCCDWGKVDVPASKSTSVIDFPTGL